MVCDKTLPCGHACCGVKGEEKCLPCLHGCAVEDTNGPKLKQDADDMCMICYTEGLSCAPSIQVYTSQSLQPPIEVRVCHFSLLPPTA